MNSRYDFRIINSLYNEWNDFMMSDYYNEILEEILDSSRKRIIEKESQYNIEKLKHDLGITGDTHGNGFSRFIKAKLNGIETLIVCGDFGYIWSDIQNNNKNLNLMDKIGIQILFVDGNHENFELLNKFPLKHWNGGWIHKIRNNVIHLMRGEVYNIKGKTIAVMGGANSIDKKMRIEGQSWWKEELPNHQERENLINNLDACDWMVDLFISHTAPSRILKEMDAEYRSDEFTDFLNLIEQNLEYKQWYFGHIHSFFESKLTCCTCLYEDIISV